MMVLIFLVILGLTWTNLTRPRPELQPNDRTIELLPDSIQVQYKYTILVPVGTAVDTNRSRKVPVSLSLLIEMSSSNIISHAWRAQIVAALITIATR